MLSNLHYAFLALGAVQTAYAANYLVIRRDDISTLSKCVTNKYYGSYGRPLRHVFHADGSRCQKRVLASLTHDEYDNLHMEKPEGMSLVWMQGAGLDDSLRKELMRVPSDCGACCSSGGEDGSFVMSSECQWRSNVKEFLQVARAPQGQSLLAQLGAPADLATDHWERPIGGLFGWGGEDSLVAVHESLIPHFDKLLPPTLSAIAIPDEPRPYVPVPPNAVDRVKNILKGLKFNPDVAGILSTFSIGSMQSDIRHLSGEDNQGIMSRHSFSQGALVAASWIQVQMEETGATCELRPFLNGFAPNIIWYALRSVIEALD